MKQYEFDPQIDDPRIYARNHWSDMRDELNNTRDALEASKANEGSQCALIDMLRRELADAKAAHERDQVALTVMRTKLKAAGMLVLDALKEDTAPEPTAHIKPLSEQPAIKITAGLVPVARDDDDDDDRVADLISRLPANRWG